MIEQENYLNLPDFGDSGEIEKFEYNSTATPYRITQVYKISYDTNLSQDNTQPSR